MTSTPVYLDYQATTPVDPSVREAMMPFLGDLFGNPHSRDHRFGWEAARDQARTGEHCSLDRRQR